MAQIRADELTPGDIMWDYRRMKWRTVDLIDPQGPTVLVGFETGPQDPLEIPIGAQISVRG